MQQLDHLGKYRIIAKLGQGGMASVFLSVVPGPIGVNKLLVVKLLREDLAQDPDFLAMFLNEARLAARLNHANVVQTYEVGVENGVHYLAMDYLDGQPLHAVIRRATRARMPLEIHVRILSEVLSGLQYAHTLRDFDGTPLYVVHRDVSPQNVFVTYDGQVKLVDFGVAKAAGAASTTQSGVFKGKLAYIAPEQADGKPADARADVFSVGVMLWEAMAGRRFATGDSQTAVLAARLAGNEPRIRQVVPDADSELADICDKAMAHAPAERFESAHAFRHELENFLDRFSRRVASTEVAEFVVGLFKEEREKIRVVIDDQLKRLASATAAREPTESIPVPTLDFHQGVPDPTPLTAVASPQGARKQFQAQSQPPQAQQSTPPALALPVVSPPDPGPASISGIHGTLVASNISQTYGEPRSSGRTLLFVLSVCAILSLSGVAFLVFFQKPSRQAASVTATASSQGASNPERVQLSITFGPPGVVAKLDGVPLDESPFVAQVPRDGSMHRIDVEGPGLAPQTKMVSYDKNVSVSLELQPAEVAASASAAAPVATVSASAAPTDGPRRPGGPLPPPRKTNQPLEIDEQDPYKK